MGSIDAEVTLSIASVNQRAVRYLSDFYTIIEDQAHKYRNIPAGYRNMNITNDIINLCGLREFLPESLIVESMDDSPGSFQVLLKLVDNPINENTIERLKPGQSFMTSQDLRLELAKIFEKHLSLVPDVFVKEKDLKLRDLKYEIFYSAKYHSNEVEAKLKERIKELRQQGYNPVVSDTALGAKRIQLENNYYIYSGSKSDRQSDRHSKFIELTETYGQRLGQLFARLVDVIQQLRKHGHVQSQYAIGDIFVLTNEDIIGIEKLQQDLEPAYKAAKPVWEDVKNLDKLDPFKRQVIQNYKERETENNRVIDAYNQAQEAEALSSLGLDSTLSKIEAEEVLAGVRSENEIRIKALIDEFFLSWQDFVYDFLDKIWFNPSLLALPQFESIRELLKDIKPFAGVNAHQDFPLDEVVGLLQSAEDDLSRHAFNKLKGFLVESGFSLRNIGLSALINPDFYFFNPQNDIIDDIIPSYVLNKAKNSIIAARREMEPAEADWFKKVYESKILGTDRSSRIAQNVLQFSFRLRSRIGQKQV